MASIFGIRIKLPESGAKCWFRAVHPRYIGHAWKNREKSENSVTRHFFLFWRLSPHKISANYILTKFRDIPLAKSVILTHFLIFHGHTLKWGFFLKKSKSGLLRQKIRGKKSVPNMFKNVAQDPLKIIKLFLARFWGFGILAASFEYNSSLMLFF